MDDLSTFLLAGTFLLQAISAYADIRGLRGRKDAESESPEFLKSWLSQRNPNKLRPYPDGFGNTAPEIRRAWVWATWSQFIFYGSMVSYWSVLGTSYFLGAPPPVLPLTVLAVSTAVGALTYRHFIRYLTHKDRRYILAHVATWLGFSLRKMPEIRVPEDPDPKITATVREHRRATRRRLH